MPSIIPAFADRSIVSGCTTRRIGDDKPALAMELQMDVRCIHSVKQVHGSDIHTIGPATTADTSMLAGDALITNNPGVVLCVRIADCAGVLLWDAVHHAVAAIHSGWRGTQLNIVGACVDKMHETYGSDPAHLRAFISPCASGARYEVGYDVARHFPGHVVRIPSDSSTDAALDASTTKWLFDNRAALTEQLLAAGVPPSHITSDTSCTIADQRFHSYRRDGSAAGRCVAFIGLRSFEALVPL